MADEAIRGLVERLRTASDVLANYGFPKLAEAVIDASSLQSKVEELERELALATPVFSRRELESKAQAVVFHYFNCDDGDGNGCGKLRPSMAILAQAIGYSDPAVNDEIASALAEVKHD